MIYLLVNISLYISSIEKKHMTVHTLAHFRLNKLPHKIYWKNPVSILGMSSYVI